jgi:iron complex outermembrane receptor protein
MHILEIFYYEPQHLGSSKSLPTPLRLTKQTRLSISCALVAFATASPAWSQTEASGDAEIIVTGTRQSGVTASQSLAPVDIISSENLASEGRPELINALSNILPSMNVQAVGFDLANETLAIRMRGLSPNHSLVLINGKRLHGTANLAVLAGPYQGGAAPDLNFVPTQAVNRIEVLKDGAAAQYGSDAIAGVVNILLATDAQGGSAALTQGGYFKGDGVTTDVGANVGFGLGGAGFVNVTGNLRRHGFSNAGGPDQRVVRAVAAGTNPEYRDLAGYPRVNKVFGDAKYNLALVALNAGIPIGDRGSIYGFGSYGRKKAGGWANFRLPQRLPALYPNGFTPIDWVIADDASLTLGVKTDLSDWAVDVSSTYGENLNRVEVTGSANIDLYRDTGATPVDFYNGNLNASQWTWNADARRDIDLGWARPATLALGAEYRRETYVIVAGDPASRYKAGSQSFPGFSLTDAGKSRRNMQAAYVDLTLQPSAQLQLSAAGRFEHFSDFGNALVGKVSIRLDLSPMLAVRGSFGNGFRAPTLAEGRYSATNVQPNSAFVQLPPNSEAARLIGIDALNAEKSLNFNFGIAAELSANANLTIDAYQIGVRDRIVGSGTLYGSYAGVLRSAAVNAAIVANGNVLEAVPFSGINVFTNGIDTRTRGVDIAATIKSRLGQATIDWIFAANYNRTQVTRIRATPLQLAASGQQLFDKVAISTLETASPKAKASLTLRYASGPLTVNFRNSFYGQSSRFADPGDGKYYLDKAGAKAITDFDMSYQLTASLKLSIGANNLFDIKPNKVNANGLAASAAAGNPAVEIYPSFAPFGINGGYYFGRIGIEF